MGRETTGPGRLLVGPGRGGPRDGSAARRVRTERGLLPAAGLRRRRWGAGNAQGEVREASSSLASVGPEVRGAAVSGGWRRRRNPCRAASHGAVAGQSRPCRRLCHSVMLTIAAVGPLARSVPRRRHGPTFEVRVGGKPAAAQVGSRAAPAKRRPTRSPRCRGTCFGRSARHRGFACATGLAVVGPLARDSGRRAAARWTYCSCCPAAAAVACCCCYLRCCCCYLLLLRGPRPRIGSSITDRASRLVRTAASPPAIRAVEPSAGVL